MPRKGRELELLVANLEKNLSGTNIEINSPDRILDKVTGKEREVDVSLKGTIGSHEILVILEVRDRQDNEDVTWIEQLATKRDDLCANKAIAISSVGFTDGARAKADIKNIELRTLEEIDYDTISDWFLPKLMEFNSRFFNIKSVFFNVESLDEKAKKILVDFLNSFDGNIPKDLKIFLQKGMEEPININELFKLVDFTKIYIDVPLNGEKILKKITLIPEDQECGYRIITKPGTEPIKIESLEVHVELWIKKEELEIKSIKEYKKPDKTYAQVINFGEVEISGRKRTIELTRIPNGEMQKLIFNFNEKNK